MAYKKTPLMFDGPTPVNMPPAMAGCGCGTGDYIAVGAEEIEMPPVYHEGILGKVTKGTALMLVGAGVLAYYLLKKKR